MGATRLANLLLLGYHGATRETERYMSSDGPTVPDVDWYESGSTPDLGTSTETPTWPGGARELPQASRPDRSSTRAVNATLFGASIGANVVLLISGLLGLLLLSHAGVFAPRGSAGSSAPGSMLTTPTTTSSPTPLAGWLRVAPSSVQLGCSASQRTHFVLVENTGPQKVHWQMVVTVSASASASQVGIAVNPNQGDLDAGASLPLQLQNTTHAAGSQGVSSQQGTIRFASTPVDAGPPPVLSYTTVGC
jgi:hypothetical protein